MSVHSLATMPICEYAAARLAAALLHPQEHVQGAVGGRDLRQILLNAKRSRLVLLLQGSRQHYCIHKTVSKERAVDEACDKLMQDDGGCRYANRAKHLSNKTEALKASCSANLLMSVHNRIGHHQIFPQRTELAKLLSSLT